MLTFGSFVEHADSVFRNSEDHPIFGKFPPLAESKIFYLGEDSDFSNAVGEIRTDLHEEMKGRVPMPFADISLVGIVRRPIPEEIEKKFWDNVPDDGVKPTLFPEGEPVWIMDRMIEVESSHPAIQAILKVVPARKDVVKQWFIFSRLQSVGNRHSMPIVFAFGYVGVDGGKVYITADRAVEGLGNNISTHLEQVAAISHPANYIVKVEPELTPKETKKVEAGRPRPPQKSTHFIVVDHEVLVGMRRDPAGTHASPTPHERRGHWRRLAERCRHAKLLGKAKVFVRPTFVGERQWKGPKAHYEVLLDFASGVRAV